MISSLKEVCPQEAGHHGCSAGEWRSWTLHASAEIVPIIDDIVSGLDAAGYSNRETFSVRLALEEALVNAIKHGHKGDTSKRVCLRYRLASECFVVEVEDEGPGFHPEEVPDPFAPENLERASGRGLLLMRNYMTWVRYNDAGNCVTMCRLRNRA
jgi:serine/threonine-protein kinase RsbW